MLKNLGLLAAGLAAGLIIMTLARPPADGVTERGTNAAHAGVDAAAPAAWAAVEARFTGLEERIADLERQRALPAGVSSPRAADISGQPTTTSSGARLLGPESIARLTAEAPRPPAMPRPLTPAEMDVSRLVSGGFARDQAEWITRKIDELRMDELRARYEAQRAGTAYPANELDASSFDRKLRAELGETDYERYLRAFGRSTVVAIANVFAGSPADRAGIKPGDEIVSYAGQRVLAQSDLNAFILDGTPGESVVVEVDRDGQRLQVVVPRGPLGVTGGAASLSSGYGSLANGR